MPENIAFQAALRAASDLSFLRTTSGRHRAGWPDYFQGDFGRDSLIKDLQILPLPQAEKYLLVDLLFLTSHQGKVDRAKDEQSWGAIPHFVCSVSEAPWHLPFFWGSDILDGGERILRYYGATDTTPLFIIACRAYWEKTGDDVFLKKIWMDNESKLGIEAALDWIFDYGGINEFGFLVNRPKRNPFGLTSRFWRDGYRNPYHFRFPLATVFCQALAYEALRAAAFLLINNEKRLGLETKYTWLGLLKRADALKEKVNREFWWPEQRYYYFALQWDGKNFEPVKRVVPEPAMALATGVIPWNRESQVIERLFSEDLATPLGIRTLSTDDPLFREERYAMGASWPWVHHQIWKGLRRGGFYEAAEKIVEMEERAYFERRSIEECRGITKKKPYRYLRAMRTFWKPANCIQAFSAGAVLGMMWPRLSDSEKEQILNTLYA